MTNVDSTTSNHYSAPWFYAGVFVLCMSTLMLQIIQTRILSVMSFYYLAFLLIGMAMFGLTTGALLVYFDRFGLKSQPVSLLANGQMRPRSNV